MTVTSDGKSTADEGRAGSARYAVCSCGWAGSHHTAPAGLGEDKAARSLLVRRQRAQDRKVLRPEWDQHVAVWLPDELPLQSAETGTGDTGGALAQEDPEPSPGPQTSVQSQERAPEADENNDVDAVLGQRAQEATEATRAAMEASARLHSAVVEARAVGMSWTRVGVLTGMSKQAAWERWRS